LVGRAELLVVGNVGNARAKLPAARNRAIRAFVKIAFPF
jgi:hypothetical protein